MFWSNERRLSGCWWDFYAEIYKLFAGKLNSKPNNINAKQTKKLTQKSYITRHINANQQIGVSDAYANIVCALLV